MDKEEIGYRVFSWYVVEIIKNGGTQKLAKMCEAICEFAQVYVKQHNLEEKYEVAAFTVIINKMLKEAVKMPNDSEKE